MAEPRPTNQGSLAADLRAMHERFVTGGLDASILESAMLRPVVAQSWLRSLAGGVDLDRGGAQTSAVELAGMREDHPLAPALPVIRRLLVEDATDTGVVVAVTAADGTLLSVEGDHKACRKAEAMNFVPGAERRVNRGRTPNNWAASATMAIANTTPTLTEGRPSVSATRIPTARSNSARLSARRPSGRCRVRSAG